MVPAVTDHDHNVADTALSLSTSRKGEPETRAKTNDRPLELGILRALYNTWYEDRKNFTCPAVVEFGHPRQAASNNNHSCLIPYGGGKGGGGKRPL